MRFSLPILAQNQQDAVLRAINDSVGSKTEFSAVYLLVAAVVVIGLIAAAYFYQRKQSQPVQSARKVFNHPRKLTKELANALDLSPAEIRKLEHHATRLGVLNPMTLLLCPSLLRKDAEVTAAAATAAEQKAA